MQNSGISIIIAKIDKIKTVIKEKINKMSAAHSRQEELECIKQRQLAGNIIIAVCVIMFCYFMHIFINTEEEIYISGAIVEIEDSVVSNQVNQIRLLQARNIAIASISLTIIFTLIILILERKWINRFNQISEEEIKLQRKQIIKLCIIPLILIAIEIIAIIIVYNNKDDEIAQINIIMKTTATSKETDYVYEEIKQIEEIESIEIESKEEVLEELGIDVEVLDMRYLENYNHTDTYFFNCKWISGNLGTGKGPEFTSKEYENRGLYIPMAIPISELPKLNVVPSEVRNLVVDDYKNKEKGDFICIKSR